jgi:glycosyltransferase involved in cell wall biosynthesis
MSALPTIGVLAPASYPKFVKNSDMWQGVHLRRIGEFSRIPVQVKGLEGLAGQLGTLGPYAGVRALALLDRQLPKSMEGRLIDGLKGYTVTSPKLLRGMQAIIGHGTFAVPVLPWEQLPPLLWGPGMLPDDFLNAGNYPPWRRAMIVRRRQRLGEKAAGVFLTSRASVKLWNERIRAPGPERVFFIPYFVPALPRSEQVTVSSERPDGELKILFVGAEARRKNLPRLIEACHLLAKRSAVPFSLTVVSDFRDGPVDVSAPFVRSLGRQPNAKVLELMRESHVLCVPSLMETFGMVYVEGLARGCVVIVPDREQQRSLFEDAVLYAEPSRAESIADALEQARDVSTRSALIEKGVALYRRQYAPDCVATAFVEAALSVAR